MIIGERIRELREEKDMSQGEIQKKTGLLRCHISRVENGRTVPGIETLEKMARALDVPLYRLFYDGEKPPALKNALKRRSDGEEVWGSAGKEARFLLQLGAPWAVCKTTTESFSCLSRKKWQTGEPPGKLLPTEPRILLALDHRIESAAPLDPTARCDLTILC